MNIEILREFADLAFTLNYKKTADRMYISPSTLSKHIMQLEKELWNVSLFHRSQQRVELTELGKAFLPKIQKTLADYDSALAVIRQEKSNISGSITIAFLDAPTKELLPATIAKYHNLYPNVSVKLASEQFGDILTAYFNNRLDVAITLLFPNSIPPASASIRTLCEDSVSVVFPKGHPLETLKDIYLADILQYPLILPSHQQFSDYARMIEDYVEHGPTPPNVICDFSHIDTAIIMAGAGMGISILPSNVANEHPKDLIFRDITDFHPLIELVAVWNKRRINPGTLEFIELLFDDLNSVEKNPSL